MLGGGGGGIWVQGGKGEKGVGVFGSNPDSVPVFIASKKTV